MILRAYKTELDPTSAQIRVFEQHVAGARFAHNWVLERWIELDVARAIALGARALAGYEAKLGENACMLGYALAALLRGRPMRVRTPKSEPSPRYRYAPAPGIQIPDFRASQIDWYSQLVHVREEQPERFGWLSELSSFAVREAVLDVGDGWKHFFEHIRAGRFERAGRPRFRTRRAGSYHMDQPNPIRVTERTITIPGVGIVRLKERGYLPVTREDSHRFPHGGKCCGIGISNKDGRWYIALRCEVPDPMRQPRGPGRALRDRVVPRIPGRRLGVENGVRILAVGYDGDAANTVTNTGLRDDARIQKLEMQRKRWERRMARRHRAGVLARLQSAGWHEARNRVAHYHARITQLRDDRVGKVVRKLVDRGAETVLLREPHVAKMLDRRTATDKGMRNALAPMVHGARMGDLRRRLEYKQQWAGGKVELVDALEPVTKRCSVCGTVRKTAPAYPDFACDTCGHSEDRDNANAARNLYSGGSSSGVDSPRSAGGKPSRNGSNGRQKRIARTEGKPEITASHCSGNRTSSGAPDSVGPIDMTFRAESENERSGAAQTGSPQFRGDTAQPEAEDRDRSQTDSQLSNLSAELRGASEAT